ncbi:MAG: glycosyltransferase family 39 protein [Acidimicrobiales bacterium]
MPIEPAAPGAEPALPNGLVVLAVVVSCLGIVGRFVVHRGLWLDEALGVNIARLPVGSMTSALRHDGHPPLSYVALHGWMAWFGTGDVAVRAFSGVISVATLPLAYVAGRRLGGQRVAWISVALVAASPFAARYATEARMYALVSFLALAAWLAVDSARRQPRLPRLALVSAIVAALLWTHYWGGWLVLAGALLLAWEARHPGRRAAATRVLIAVGVGVVAFLPWLPVVIDQVRNTGTPWGRTRSPFAIAAVTVNALGGTPDTDHGARMFEGEVYGIALVVLIVLGTIGVNRWAARRPTALASLTIALGGLGCVLSATAFASRYAAVAAPFFVLAAAVALAGFSDRVAWVGVAAALAFGALFTARNIREPRSQLPDLVAIVNARAAAGDVVVYCPDQLGPAGSRGLRADLVGLAYPTLGDPRFVDWRDYEDRNARTDPLGVATTVLDRAAGHDIWLMSRGGYRTFGDQCERLQGALETARPHELVQAAGAVDATLELAALERLAHS